MAAAGEDERYKVVSFYKFGRSEWTESWWMERRDLNCRIGFFKMSRVPIIFGTCKKYFLFLACLGMWQMRKMATMTTRTMARFASRRPDLPERMWVYLQHSTVQYSTCTRLTLQSGRKFPRYLHKYIYIYLSIYS